MMYLRTENEKGVITFTPLNDQEIYIFCKHCRKIVKVERPGEIAWEVGSFEALDICEECNRKLVEQCEDDARSEEGKRLVEALKRGGVIK